MQHSLTQLIAKHKTNSKSAWKKYTFLLVLPIMKWIRWWLVFKLKLYKYMLPLSRNIVRRVFGTKQPNPIEFNWLLLAAFAFTQRSGLFRSIHICQRQEIYVNFYCRWIEFSLSNGCHVHMLLFFYEFYSMRNAYRWLRRGVKKECVRNMCVVAATHHSEKNFYLTQNSNELRKRNGLIDLCRSKCKGQKKLRQIR